MSKESHEREGVQHSAGCNSEICTVTGTGRGKTPMCQHRCSSSQRTKMVCEEEYSMAAATLSMAPSLASFVLPLGSLRRIHCKYCSAHCKKGKDGGAQTQICEDAPQRRPTPLTRQAKLATGVKSRATNDVCTSQATTEVLFWLSESITTYCISTSVKTETRADLTKCKY